MHVFAITTVITTGLRLITTTLRTACIVNCQRAKGEVGEEKAEKEEEPACNLVLYGKCLAKTHSWLALFIPLPITSMLHELLAPERCANKANKYVGLQTFQLSRRNARNAGQSGHQF